MNRPYEIIRLAMSLTPALCRRGNSRIAHLHHHIGIAIKLG